MISFQLNVGFQDLQGLWFVKEVWRIQNAKTKDQTAQTLMSQNLQRCPICVSGCFVGPITTKIVPNSYLAMQRGSSFEN